MKEILATWIIIQLIIIGSTLGSIHNEIENGTFECEAGDEMSLANATLFPLVFFLPAENIEFISEYCENHDNR